MMPDKSNKGFVLGLVLLVCLLLAVFIFSYNSIVRNSNLRTHHDKISQTANHLAVSAATLISKKLGDFDAASLQAAVPDLFAPGSTVPTSINLSTGLANRLRDDCQRFFNQLHEIRTPGVITSAYPQIEDVKIAFDNITPMAPGTDVSQFEAGRDPIEKYGELEVSCTVSYGGLKRKASVKRQFRVVNMVPGPYCRFSLFISTTPNPHSYNAMGIYFDGSVEPTYSHAPVSKRFSGNLRVYNSTDTLDVTPTAPEKTLAVDKQHLRNRGWVFIGPSPQVPGQPIDQREGPVYLKIPSGFADETGGEFMLGWPSSLSSPVLLPELIENPAFYEPAASFNPHSFMLGATYRGYYVAEDGNNFGAGGRNLWPNLTAGGGAFTPADHFLSASSWLYPFGTTRKSSRTLVVGPALAGFLKFYFIRGGNTDTGEQYRGIFTSMPQTDFDSLVAANAPLNDFAGAGLWAGNLSPAIAGEDLFLQGFDSFLRLMPYNSLPNVAVPLSGGVAMNLLFDFMKYNRTSYPQIDAPPSIASADYASDDFLVPGHADLNLGPVAGLHPYNNMRIFFRENGEYNPSLYPDNCYFSGDLRRLTVGGSSLMRGRVTHILDMDSFATTAEENERVEKYLFKTAAIGGDIVSVPRRSGIFYIRRRSGAGSTDTDALRLSSRTIVIDKPLIVVVSHGSIEFDRDIRSTFDNGQPEHLASIALRNGDFYLNAPAGATRRIDAYLAALSGTTGSGRLLNKGSANSDFQINGGLAVTEMGLYLPPGTRNTMTDFPAGGEINYNSLFNPSAATYNDAYMLILEDQASRVTVEAGG